MVFGNRNKEIFVEQTVILLWKVCLYEFYGAKFGTEDASLSQKLSKYRTIREDLHK